MNKLLMFFYNIIPGSLFLIGLQSITHISIYSLREPDWIYKAIIFSFFLGLAFQEITKFIRKNFGFDQSTWENVSEKRDKKSFEIACKTLVKWKLIEWKKGKKMDKKELKKAFYLMHNFIGIKRDSGAGYIGQKTAFWFNIAIGAFFLGIIVYAYNCICSLFLITFSVLTWKFIALELHKALYDTVLKTFVTNTVAQSTK